MDVPLQISFRDMEPSPAIEALVREKAKKLERFGRLTSCRVVIEAPHQRHNKGKIYHVTVEMGIPGHKDLVVSREPEVNPAHEDAYIAVRDAFDKAQRRLQDFNDKIDGKTKRKQAQATKQMPGT